VPNQYSVGFKQFLGTAKVEKMVLMARIHTYAHPKLENLQEIIELEQK
jgi:hypothetical protein